MTFYGIEFTWTIGDYRFEVGYDSGSGCSLDERTISWQQRVDDDWSAAANLRSYYFEDVKRPIMRNFCQKFATDQQYRAACLAGGTDWAIRNALFERNNSMSFTPPQSIQRAHRAIGDSYQIWTFIKRHWQAIVARPEYTQIAATDSSFMPSYHELDPEIRPAVQAFNQITDIETLFSCQGVTATLDYAGYDILVVSQHELFGYISFKSLAPDLADQLKRMARERGLASLHDLTLFSTGDNPAFREEAIRLAGELQQYR